MHKQCLVKKYPLKIMLDACKKYQMPNRRLLTFEYILIDGINSSVHDAEKLAKLLKDQRCKLNLMVFNEFPGSPYKSPPKKDVEAFQHILINKHYSACNQCSEILAACGQLSGSMKS